MRQWKTFALAPIVGAALIACSPQATSQPETDTAGEPPAATEIAAGGADSGAAPADDTAAGGAPTGGDTATAAAGGSAASVGDLGAVGENIAVVNGEPITLAEFQKQAFDTQRYFIDQGGIDPNTEKGQGDLLLLRRSVLSDMINQALIEQAAKELNITATDAEVEASLKKYIDELGGEDKFEQSLADTQSSREEVREMEKASIIGTKMLDQIAGDVPSTAEFVHARHILCVESADTCQNALLRLEGGEDFAAVAKELSEDRFTKDRGGDLDWVARGMLPSQELEEAIFGLQSGQRSSVIKTQFGYHVIEVMERDPERALDESQRTRLKERKLIEWQDARRKASKIEITVEDLKDVADGMPIAPPVGGSEGAAAATPGG